MKFVKALMRAAKSKADLLTEQQAAAWLDTSIFTLRRERKRGNIGFAMIGNRARYSIADLQSYVERMSSQPCPKTASKSENTISPVTKNSPIWKATWFDAASRQTKRRSLGTEDFQDAKVRLAELVTKQATLKDHAPADMPLAIILVRYWVDHGQHLPSKEVTQYALGFWTAFWGEATIADLTLPRQKHFVAWLKAKGYANSYVSRILSVGRAAIRLAWKNGEITSTPFIMDVSDRSDAKDPRPLDKDELRTLLTTVQGWPHLYGFTMIALNTLARPEAVLDLAPAQVDLEDLRINLNPKGRKQTKKYRPIVPITNTLLPFVQRRDVVRFVNWHGEPIADIKKGFKTVVRAAGLDDTISAYSLRHTMAKELRKRGVPPWEVEGLLGHRRPGVTETYASFSPDYLSKGREAIDAYFADLGVSLPVPDTLCVSVACQSPETEKSPGGDFLTKSRRTEWWA